MTLADLVQTHRAVTETGSRLEKIGHLAACLRRLTAGEVPVAVAWLAGELRQGRIGVGPALLGEALQATPAGAPGLTLARVDAAFEELSATAGPGSTAERARRLAALFGRATREEQQFLARLLLGELRQGALAGIMAEAVARAAGVPAAAVRRAQMLSGDLAAVAAAALAEGSRGLGRFSIRLFRPVLPMLAQAADDLPDALGRLGRAALEWKLDGARVQVHKEGEEVRVFSRKLNEVTPAVPELVEAVRALPAEVLILDGEALALREDGTPFPFQATMRRFGRKLDVEWMRRALPLRPFFFDCLLLERESLIERPAAERFEALAAALPSGLLVPRLVTGSRQEAAVFLAEALARGHEGVMAKALDAAYEAGRRGLAWLKVKPARTLDLVVLAAEWGHGRRQGYLSNLHLGARDPQRGGFVMLGKTFKGMTDEMLAWQTSRLQALAIARDPWTVFVRPELVVEVDFNEIQASPRYPGGLALRFARVKAYRPDKRPEEADTIDTVRGIFARQRGELEASR